MPPSVLMLCRIDREVDVVKIHVTVECMSFENFLTASHSWGADEGFRREYRSRRSENHPLT